MVSARSTDDHSTAPQDTPAAAPLLLTANGSRDSHAVITHDGRKNISPRAGTPYRGVSWAKIRELIAAPGRRKKNDAPFVILSSYRHHDGRTHEVQRESGEFHGLAVDIDKGSPTLAEVTAAAAAVTGGAMTLVYSSSSATHEQRKWRILIPLARPLPGADYADTQTALFSLLRERGLIPDPALARTAQPVYLPNVPPEKRDPDGRPVFYQSCCTDGPLLDLAADTAVVEAREALRETRAARAAAAAAIREQRRARMAAAGDTFDPIAHFNENHDIAALLRLYGFVQKPRAGEWWKSPLSQSGSYSTRNCGDHWVTFSAWAHDHDVGRESKNGNRYGDAFSLFKKFEHGNDTRAAIEAYCVEIGRWEDPLDDIEPVVVEALPDRGPVREIDDWRLEMRAERALALRMPGLHLDRSQTGSGKTRATTDAIIEAIETTGREAAADDTVQPLRRTLTALPDHANIRERVDELQAAGIDAVAYPARDESNCRNMEAVRRAEGLGLIPGAAVCSRCPHKDGCAFIELVKLAKDADHSVCTHERLRLAPGPTTAERDIVVIDETPESVLAPRISVRVDDLAPVVTLARTVRDEWIFRRGHVIEGNAEEREFAGQIVAAYELVAAAAKDATTAGVVEITLPAAAEVPKGWQATILRWAVEAGLDPGPDRLRRERFQKSMRLLTMIVTGGLQRLHLLIDKTSRHEKQPDGTVQESDHLHHFVVGSWTTALPDVPVLLLDATGSAADIEAATGKPVRDITPAGHLPNVAPVVQIPWDVIAGQSPSAAAGFVEAFLQAHPEVQRLGVIGHRKHIRAMMHDDRVLPERLRSRIAKSCYYGQGPDRASNDWHETCDAILIVGTLRVGGGPTRERLVAHGKVESAREDGGWVPRHWDGRTTDGRAVRVEGRGYRHPDWHEAHVALGRAAVHQAAGRGRSITDRGIPVWVISDEPLGVPVDDSLKVVDWVVREAVEAVREVRDGDASSLFPISESYREKSGSQTLVRVSAVVAHMREKEERRREREEGRGLGRSGAEKRLRLARQHGRLTSPKRGWLAVVGDTTAEAPVAAPAAPAAQERPALVRPPVQAVVISATGPASDTPVIEAAAAGLPAAGTSTCTTTVPAAAVQLAEGLVADAEERAAIMEFDAGVPRDVADRLAREMVFGRDDQPAAAGEPAVVAAVDVVSLAAREEPFPKEVLGRIPGRVTVIDPRRDPFAGRARSPSRPSPGVCRCGCKDWVEVLIHPAAGGGFQSARMDCGRCGGFGWYSRWYGQAQTDPRPPTAASSSPLPAAAAELPVVELLPAPSG